MLFSRIMHRLIIIPLLALLASCGGKQGEVVIKGRFSNLQQAEFYIYSLDNGRTDIDTIHVKSGRFEYRAALTGDAVYHLVYPHLAEQVVFASGGDVLTVEGDAANLREVQVKGNNENKLYTRLRLQLCHVNGEQQKDSIVRGFIAEHSDTRTAAYLQQELRQRGPMKPLIRVGASLPHVLLTATDSLTVDSLDGRRIGRRLLGADSLALPVEGERLLIAFVNNWSIDRLGTTSRLHEILARIDTLSILVYSADVDYREFTRSLSRDSLTAEKYAPRCRAFCDRMALRSPLIMQWRINEFPLFVLVDADGRISCVEHDFDRLVF